MSMSRIISIANQKGSRQTTTNVNLSACLADKGKGLVIDIDPQEIQPAALELRRN